MARKPVRRKPAKKAKKRKKASSSGKKTSINLFAGLFVLLLIGALIAFPLMQSRKGGNASSPRPQSTLEPQQPKVPPKFKKEGSLAFIKSASGDSVHIDIEIAQTERETTQGLMFRTQMGERQGMLFIFDDSEMRSFWMKNTYIPLDIIYVNERYEIVTIRANAQPFSRASLGSTAEAQYVVEVNGGFCATHGIQEGDRIAFEVERS